MSGSPPGAPRSATGSHPPALSRSAHECCARRHPAVVRSGDDHTVILAVLGTWLVLSAVLTVPCAAVLRGGMLEDRALGYTPDLG